jgi:serine/threonine-protein kinase HipA
MSVDSLHVIHGEISVGTLVYDRKRDQIELQYDESWQFGSESFPMSLSLPLSRKVHPDERIRPFLQGLLPDNPAVIEAWGKTISSLTAKPVRCHQACG